MALSLGIKRLKSEADHSFPFNADVKKYKELYLHSLIRLYSIGNISVYVHMGNILTRSGNPICTKITFGLNSEHQIQLSQSGMREGEETV